MKRRQYIQSVGGIAFAPALSFTRDSHDSGLTPEEFVRRLPETINGKDFTNNIHDLPEKTLVRSVVSKVDPQLRFCFDSSDEEFWVRAGGLIYEPSSVADGVSFLREFDAQVEYERAWTENGMASYDRYTIDKWTLIVPERYRNGASNAVAVFDGARKVYEDKDEKRRKSTEKLNARLR